MKKSIICLILISACRLCLLAQINNTELLFYVRSSSTTGETWSKTNPETQVRIYKFSHGEICEVSGPKGGYSSLKEVSDNLKNSMNYYEQYGKVHNLKEERFPSMSAFIIPYHFDKEMSNNKWNVYSAKWKATPPYWPVYTQYYAFKTDYSEYLSWQEPDFDKTGRLRYYLMSKEELRKLSFTSARDFLQ